MRKNPWLLEVLFDWLDTALEFIAALGYRPDWYLDEYARRNPDVTFPQAGVQYAASDIVDLEQPDVSPRYYPDVTFGTGLMSLMHTQAGEAAHAVRLSTGKSLCGIVPAGGWHRDRIAGMRLCKWCEREESRERGGD